MSHAKAQSRQGSRRLSGLCALAALRETKSAFRMPLGSNPDLWPFFAFHELPGRSRAAEGVADLPEIRRLVADGERGRDRVVRGGVEVDRHPRRQRVIGAPVAPDDAGPILHRGCVRFGSMPQREFRQIPLQGRQLLRSLTEVELANVAVSRKFIAKGHHDDALARRGREVVRPDGSAECAAGDRAPNKSIDDNRS